MTRYVGFTGRRDGMTEHQYEIIRALLIGLACGDTEIQGLHGDCIGADAEFDAICKEIGIQTAKLPCTWKGVVDHELRANCDAIQLAEPMRPYRRNRAIVHRSFVLLGTPPTDEYVDHSGTWYTLTYAAEKDVPRVIVPPQLGLMLDD